MLQTTEKTRQQRFLEDVELLNLRHPIAEIAKKTGFKKPNVSRYVSGLITPSDNFLKKFYESYQVDIDKKRPAVPQNGVMEGISSQGEEGPLAIITRLVNSNSTLAEANKRLADAHYIIAKNSEDLIKMIKPNATDEDLREIVRAFGTKLAAVEDVFSVELTKGKKDEIARIREALHKREDEIQNLVQQIGNSVNTGI